MLEAHFIDRESFTIAGVAAAGQPGELDYGAILEKQYMPLDGQLKPHSIDGGCYGVTLNEGDHPIYLAGVALAGAPELPAGVEKHRLPAAHYAVFDCTLGSLAATARRCTASGWMPRNGSRTAPRLVLSITFPGMEEVR